MDKRPISKEEIALRLVEAWGNQEGAPVYFDRFIENYDKALEHLKEVSDDKS